MDLDAHIVSHTHWDREWYHPLERFRQRLVALVDELLDDPSPNGSFLLDGQAIVLEDYLDVQPDRAADVTAALTSGRLEAGPWYVLADELIPSGEAMIRNLLTGRRVLRRFGAVPPPVLYCPDSFGHPAALPSLAAGFGLPLIILWRGYGGQGAPRGDTARWIAPSGDSALLYHLPRDGYEFGSHLPRDGTGAAARWQRMRDELVPRSATGVMLIPNGADHHAPQIGHAEALAALESAGATDGVHRSSLAAFAATLVERAKEVELPVVRGELRDSYGYTWTLQGTFATRAHEKRSNAEGERLLLREAEPWSALAARRGGRFKPLVDAAWRTLLAAHPHDTLCGCSIDDVAQAMELRVRSASNQARGVVQDAMHQLIGYDAPAARDVREQWQPVVLVRNPAPRPRSGVAIVEIEEFVEDVPVGPGSAPRGGQARAVPRGMPTVPALGTLQLMSKTTRNSRIESARHYPDNDLVSVSTVAAWIPESPPYGITSYGIGTGARRRQTVPHPVTVGSRWLENGLISVGVTTTGKVTFDDVQHKRHIESLIEFVDDSDVGDLYTPAPRPRTFTAHFGGVRRVHLGPLRGELALSYEISDDGVGVRAKLAYLTVHLILDANSPFVRVHITGMNRRSDHRLRVVFGTDVAAGEIWADAAFGPILREPILVDAASRTMEHAPPTAPLHRYVSRFTTSGGATLFSDGLAEYEARDDGSTLVTLVRAVGELSRNDLPERPGHAGWPSATPQAQCIGPFDARFAVLLHGPRARDTVDLIERTADDVLGPLTGTTLRSALTLPTAVEGVELIGTGLAFSAMKQSEDGDWLVLRCVNLCEHPTSGSWRIPFEVREAWLARLDETMIQELASADRIVDFVAPPFAIVTVLVR